MMPTDRNPPTADIQVTAAEIADLAAVSRAAVSNWRRRYDDFPEPAAVAPGGGDLFRLDEVERWLRDRGRLTGPVDREKSLWQAVEGMRNVLPPDQILQIGAAFLSWLSLDHDRHYKSVHEARRQGELADAVGLSVATLRRVLPDDDAFQHIFEPLRGLGGSLYTPLLSALLDLATESDDLGELFEVMLGRLGRLRVYGASDFESTPSLSDLMIKLADPTGVVYDPAAGQGGFLLAAATYGHQHRRQVSLAGQEINRDALRIARSRSLAHGLEANLHAGNSLLVKEDMSIYADVVLCEPPFGLRWPDDPDPLDPRWFAGPPTEANADLSWVQYAIYHLKPSGRGYVVLPTGSLSRGGREGAVRRELLRRGCIEAIVGLPSGLVKSSSLPTSIWILRSLGEPSPGSVLLIDAAAASGHETRSALDDATTTAILESLRRFRASPADFPPVSGFAVAPSVMDLLGGDGTLAPSRWTTEPADPADAIASIERAVTSLAEARDRAQQAPAVLAVRVSSLETPRATVKVGELVEAGALELIKGVPIPRDIETSPNGAPVLRSPWSRRTDDVERRVLPTLLRGKPKLTEPMDVVVMVVGRVPRAFIDLAGGHLLPDFMQALRVKGASADPVVLAALLSAPSNSRFVAGNTIPRLSLLDIELPRLPAAEMATLHQVLLSVTQQERVAAELHQNALDVRDRLAEALVAGHVTMTLSPAEIDGDKGGNS